MPDITSALIATAIAGNSAAQALAFRLHEAYETAKWDTVERAIDLGMTTSLHDPDLQELIRLLIDPDTPSG